MKLPWQKPERDVVRPSYADYETLVSDRRVTAIADLVIDEFRAHGLDEESDFVTFIQPPQVVKRQGVDVPIPEVGVFAVISDNPRAPGHQVMTQASVWLHDWLATDAARLHFVSGPQDPAYPIFREVAKTHLRTIRNLREMQS